MEPILIQGSAYSSTQEVPPVQVPTRYNSKMPPTFLPKGANFVKISADYTHLRIKYSKAIRIADDGIKIVCPNVETFRSINKYLVDNREIKADLCGQGFPVHSVQTLPPRRLPTMTDPRGPSQVRGGKIRIPKAYQCVRFLGHPSRGPTQKRWLRTVPPMPTLRSCSRKLQREFALREMSGSSLDQRLPTYQGLRGKTILRQLWPKSYGQLQRVSKSPQIRPKTQAQFQKAF
ncbi:hypothetical protein EVAR_57696_1 [Eumeta japonica]|uniref:Uncharacterized protein n=1 Tax=Eumeta variegata TaxID=151549 RepID=A0A4C1Y8X6_EUMVA|nr:hypothetical protein EVAR_57696_1 [Eumeta japonica]